MSRLVESIKVVDGEVLNLKYHISRMNHTRKSLFNIDSTIDLSLIKTLAKHCTPGVYKCRIIYTEIIEEITFEIYYPKMINLLKIINNDVINYDFKYEDRSLINDLYSKREQGDDVLIVKNGLLTDSSYCNIALYNSPKWVTPRNPLLKGTKRAYLIEDNVIIENDIPIEHLEDYSKICLFNSMIDFNSIVLEIKNIIL